MRTCDTLGFHALCYRVIELTANLLVSTLIIAPIQGVAIVNCHHCNIVVVLYEKNTVNSIDDYKYIIICK